MKNVVAMLWLLSFASGVQAGEIYVGNYQVDDGPIWTTNPTVYSATEAAALLFGGVASDYDISTVSSDPTQINNMGWYTVWGIAGGAIFNEDYKLDLGAPGYNAPGGTNTAASAYTNDNARGAQYTNFAFRVSAPAAQVPEPGSIALLAMGLLGFVVQRRKRVQT